MKKIVLFVLAATFALCSLTACNGNKTAAADPTAVPATDTPTVLPTYTPTAEPGKFNVEKVGVPDNFIPHINRVKDWWEGDNKSDNGPFKVYFGNVSYYIGIDEHDATIERRDTDGSRTTLHGVSQPELLEAVTDKGLFVNSEKYGFEDDDCLLPFDMLFYIDGLTGEHIEIGPSLFGCVLMDSCLVGMQKETLDNGKTVMKVVKLKIDTREYTEIARYEIEGYEPTEFYGVSFDGKTIYYTMVNYNEMNKAHTTDFGIYRLDIESGESFKVSDEGMPVGLTENSTLQYCVL